MGLLSPPFFLPLITIPSTAVLSTDRSDLVAQRQPTSAVTTWDDFCQSTRLLTILTGIVTFVCVFAVPDTGPATDTHQPALACIHYTLKTNSSSCSTLTQSSRHAANSAGLAATWRASPAVHRLPFPFVLVGYSSLSSPAFLPWPQSCVVAQFTVRPASLPGDFPVSLGWLQKATKGQAEPLPSAKTWEASIVEEAMSAWQKKAANATPEIFNTLRVICPPITRSRFSATCTQCCKHPETFSALSCDLATRLFTCLPAGPGHRISCPDIDRAIKSR